MVLLGSFTAEGRDIERGDAGSGVLFPPQQLPGQGSMAGAAPPARWHSGWKERSGVSTRHAAALRLPPPALLRAPGPAHFRAGGAGSLPWPDASLPRSCAGGAATGRGCGASAPSSAF